VVHIVIVSVINLLSLVLVVLVFHLTSGLYHVLSLSGISRILPSCNFILVQYKFICLGLYLSLHEIVYSPVRSLEPDRIKGL
jgi:hypothetical protein